MHRTELDWTPRVWPVTSAQADLLRAVAAVRTADLDRTGIHEVDGRVSIADLLAFLPGHQRDHADQLAALLG